MDFYLWITDTKELLLPGYIYCRIADIEELLLPGYIYFSLTDYVYPRTFT